MALGDAHVFAVSVSPMVSNVVSAVANGYASFAVLPDGSKEWWEESRKGDEARQAIIDWLERQAYEDGSNKFSWVEVSFGELAATRRSNDPHQEPGKLMEGERL